MSEATTGIIYLIRNTNNSKVYVGLTRKTTQRRWAQHKYDATSERGNAYPIHLAMRKYGIDSFSIEELESAPVSELGEVEKKWIRHFNSADRAFGYNISHGGEGPEHSEETREKLRIANLGRRHTAEAKEKIRQANVGKKYSNEVKAKLSAMRKGKSHRPFSQETRDKMSAAKRGRPSHRKGVPLTDETKAKISATKRAANAAKPPRPPKPPKAKTPHKIRRITKPRSEEFRRKQSEAHKGKKMSDDTKALMKSGQQARREREQREFDAMTPEQQAQVSAARRGRKFSEESKQKMRESAIIREARKKAAKGKQNEQS